MHNINYDATQNIFSDKPIPTLRGEAGERIVKIAERNKRKYLHRKKKSSSVDTIKKVMEKQERYLRSQC